MKDNILCRDIFLLFILIGHIKPAWSATTSIEELPSPDTSKATQEQKYQCLQDPIQKILVFPPLFFETDITNQREIWENLKNLMTQNKQLKVTSWERMSHLPTHLSPYISYEINLQSDQHREYIKQAHHLAQLAQADAWVTTLVHAQKAKIQIYSTQDRYLLWEQESPHPPFDTDFKGALKQNLDIMLKDFLKSFPYHGTQILDPLWEKTILEKDFQNLAKVDVGFESPIEKKDSLFWIEVCRVNQKPLFINGGRVSILAKGKVLKKERGVLLADVKSYRSGLNDWRQRLHQGTLVFSPLDDKIEGSLLSTINKSELEKSMQPTKNKASQLRPHLTVATGVFSFLILLVLLL